MVRCVLHGAFYLKIIRSPYDLEDCKMHCVTSFKLTVFKRAKNGLLYSGSTEAVFTKNCFTV